MTDLKFQQRIIAETDGIIAWNKPTGLLTSGQDLQDPDCAQYWAMQYAGDMVWVLHQIDRDTSGVLLFAKKKKLVQRWQKRWHTSQFRKYYAALVHGQLDGDSSTIIDAPLKRMGRKGYTEVEVNDDGKEARTEVWQLSTTGNYSLVVARLHTGRTHQIRAHMQHIGCPLIGEERYNAIPCGHHDRHALHALAIVTDRAAPLDHMEAPMPDDLCRTADTLGIDLQALDGWASRVGAGMMYTD